VYPLTGDPQKARQLLGGRHFTALLYTCNTAPCARRTQILTTDLAAVGIDVVVAKKESVQVMLSGAGLTNKSARWDIALAGGWGADYPDPSDFLNLLLAEGATGSAPSFRSELRQEGERSRGALGPAQIPGLRCARPRDDP
jgi:ABC-type oligopeptide transport system substrate-binding subunit